MTNMFDNFWGNPQVVQALEQMIEQGRLSQTLLFSGPEGVGKATLARRLGAHLLGHAERIEQDDLGRPENLEAMAAREKLPRSTMSRPICWTRQCWVRPSRTLR